MCLFEYEDSTAWVYICSKKKISAWHLGVCCATMHQIPCNVAKIYIFNIG